MLKNFLIVLCSGLVFFACTESDNPSGPTYLSAEVTDLQVISADGGVTMAWIDPVDLDFEHVEITFSPSASGIDQPRIVQKNAQVDTISGLINGETYAFVVKIANSEGQKSKGVSEQALVGVPPEEVTELGTACEDGCVTLAWEDPTDDDFDHIEISFTPSVEEISQPVIVSKGANSKRFSGLTNDTTYIFTIQTVDSLNNISTGITINATPEIPPYAQGAWTGIIHNTTYTAVYYSVSGSEISGRTTIKFPFSNVTIICYVNDDIPITGTRFSYTRGSVSSSGGQLDFTGTFSSGKCFGTATYNEDSFIQRAFMTYAWTGESEEVQDSTLSPPRREINFPIQWEIIDGEDVAKNIPDLRSSFERIAKSEDTINVNSTKLIE
ncbi:hypothetical protein ACFLQJ_02770 [Calditrichota bacterium]